MGRPVVHFEVAGNDAEQLQAFYGELFDWAVDRDNPMKYGLVKESGPGGIGGGIAKLSDADRKPYVTFYVEVEDVAECLQRATQLGGKILMEQTEVAGMVTLGMFADPEGNAIGVVKQQPK